jgi:hypothetical protein
MAKWMALDHCLVCSESDSEPYTDIESFVKKEIIDTFKNILICEVQQIVMTKKFSGKGCIF